MNYIALIHKEDNSDYGVSFPDFPGCVTAGRTLDEAKTLAQDALSEHVSLLREMGEPIPSPSSLDVIMADSAAEGAVAFLVKIPSMKTVRVNVTIAQDILQIIDQKAHQHHMTRSAFLAFAALHCAESVKRVRSRTPYPRG